MKKIAFYFDWVFNISVILTLVFLISWVFYTADDVPVFKGKTIKTVATLTEVIYGYKNGAKGRYDYTVNNKEYYVIKALPIAYDNDDPYLLWRYVFLCDSLDPENMIFVRHNPVFYTDEPVDSVLGVISDVTRRVKWFSGASIAFKYFVKGKEYEVYQSIKDNSYLEQHPEIKVGAKFPVWYWTIDPRRAIMDYYPSGKENWFVEKQ